MITEPTATNRTDGRAKSKGLASNGTSQLLTFAFRAVSGVGVVLMLARSGGPHALGVVQFALTVTSLLPFFYGVPTLLAREVARRPEDGRRWMETGTCVSLAFGILFTSLLFVGPLVLGASRETVLAIGIAGAGMAFDGIARVQFAAFWAWERLGIEARVTGLQEAAYLGGAAIALAMGGGPVAVVAVFAGSRALGAAWAWVLVGRELGGLPWPRMERGSVWRTLRQCTPFALGDTLALTNSRFDTVMLGVWVSPAAVGLYQAATNLVLHFNVLARSINRAIFPRMGRAWHADRDDFRRLRDFSLRLIALIALPITCASLLLAPRTIDFLYGPEFAAAVLTYQLLIVVIPVRMALNTMSISVAATDHQMLRTIATATGAVLNVGLNVIFIPRWSYLGAAVTTVICEVCLLVAHALILRRVAGPSQLIRSNGWPLVACVPMAAAILLTADQHVIVSGALGVLAYAAAVAGVALVKARIDGRKLSPRALAVLVEPAR